MSSVHSDPIDFYAKHGPISAPGRFAHLLEELPVNIDKLCSAVQGVLIHVFWAERYGVNLPDTRSNEVNMRHVDRIIGCIQELEAGGLSAQRPPDKRFAGNCRTFSVLLSAILRQHGVPSRARCGFANYFEANRSVDHWVCEYWDEDKKRWIRVDAQLDEFQRRELGLIFDPLDVPRDQFLAAGRAWIDCREGRSDPDSFGVFDMKGLWFVRGNLVRDVAALNKTELLPWDGWGLIDCLDVDITDEGMVLLDRAAALTAENVDFEQVQLLYCNEEDFRVPEVIKSYTNDGTIAVRLSTEETL